MDLATRNDYLLAMGIMPWIDRARIAERKASDNPLVVVAEWTTDELRLSPDHPAGDLLGNILRAVKLSPGDFQLKQIRSASELAAATEGAGQVLAFINGGSNDVTVALPALQTMLTDRAQKKIAWDRLKPWVGKLG